MSKDLGKLMDFSEPKKEKPKKKKQKKEKCPYCGKMYKSVGRHIPYCKKNPDKKEVTETETIDKDSINKIIDKLNSISIDYETYQRINTVLNMLKFDKTTETLRSSMKILKGYSRSPKEQIKKEITNQINLLLN